MCICEVVCCGGVLRCCALMMWIHTFHATKGPDTDCVGHLISSDAVAESHFLT